ncbi:helix-turn-helix transcriptional regulator [Zhongshania sp. BJYM1]|uniref:helix-turn-helix transcriptional regulator n=1 Tax=Zhongshania aquatica TaxID=2965069 RepID=UPI0022B34C4F|nr:helix-turn-helix transcriptional regulator [Marortus sp. BJYM1]
MADLHVSPQMDAVIHSIYHGMLESPPWQQFLGALSELLDGNFATLLLRPPNIHEKGVVLNSVFYSTDIYHAYNDTYFALDPFVNLPDGDVVTIAEFLSKDEFEQSEYFRSYLQPSNVMHILGADLWGKDGLLARLRVTRPAGVSDFGEAEKSLCKQLLPHLRQAIEIHSRLQESELERGLYADTFGQLAVGVVTLDTHGHVLSSNPVAARLIESSRGVFMRKRCFQLADVREQKAFSALFSEVVTAHHQQMAGCVRAFRLADIAQFQGINLLLRPLPLSDRSGEHSPAVAIFITDPMAPRQAPSDVLIALFGLTPAEARLAIRLVNGLSLDEAAVSLGVSRNTAKSHLSAVFSKTGVTRQTQLIQLILNSVVTLAG